MGTGTVYLTETGRGERYNRECFEEILDGLAQLDMDLLEDLPGWVRIDAVLELASSSVTSDGRISIRRLAICPTLMRAPLKRTAARTKRTASACRLATEAASDQRNQPRFESTTRK